MVLSYPALGDDRTHNWGIGEASKSVDVSLSPFEVISSFFSGETVMEGEGKPESVVDEEAAPAAAKTVELSPVKSATVKKANTEKLGTHKPEYVQAGAKIKYEDIIWNTPRYLAHNVPAEETPKLSTHSFFTIVESHKGEIPDETEALEKAFAAYQAPPMFSGEAVKPDEPVLRVAKLPRTGSVPEKRNADRFALITPQKKENELFEGAKESRASGSAKQSSQKMTLATFPEMEGEEVMLPSKTITVEELKKAHKISTESEGGDASAYDLEKEFILASKELFDGEKNVDLPDVVRRGLSVNPSMMQALYAQDIARAMYEETLSAQGPQISGFTNFTVDYDSSDQKSSRFTNTSRVEAGLRTNYTLFTFGAASSREQASLSNIGKADQEYEQQKQGLAFEIASTYLELIRQRELVEIEQFRLREHISFLQLIERAYEMEQTQRSQLYVARMGLSQRKQSLLSAERQLVQVEKALERLSGKNLAPGTLATPRMPVVILPSEEEFVQAGLTLSPQVKALQSALDAAQHEYAALQKDRFGSVNANGNVSTDRILREKDASVEMSAKLGLEYVVPLYTSGGTQARLAQARARVGSAQAQLDAGMQALEEQLRLAYYVINSSDEMKRLAQQEEKDGYTVLDVFRGEVEYGTRSFSDIVSQIDSVAAARNRAVSADISKTLAAYAILRFQNGLLDYFERINMAGSPAQNDKPL